MYGYTAEDILDQYAQADADQKAAFIASQASQIAAMQVRTPAQMQDLISKACEALQLRANYQFCSFPPKPTDIPSIARAFQQTKGAAAQANLEVLEDAVVVAASWFWENVEKPAQQGSTGSGSGKKPLAILPPATENPAAPIYQRKWFAPTLVGSIVVIGALALYYRRGE